MPRKYKPKEKRLPTKYSPGFVRKMDGRYEVVKGLQDAFQQIADDLGGEESLSRLHLGLIERTVFLEFQLREWERQVLMGELQDEAIGRWVQALNTYVGLARVLGLGRSRLAAADALYADTEPADAGDKPPSNANGAEQGEGG